MSAVDLPATSSPHTGTASFFQVRPAATQFLIPLSQVQECAARRARGQRREPIHRNGAALPFVRLRDTFALEGPAPARESLVVVHTATTDGQALALGIVVDELLGECAAPVTPIGEVFRRFRPVSGSVVFDDGIALILDTGHFTRRAFDICAGANPFSDKYFSNNYSHH